MNTCRTMRIRLAPSAVRTAISLARPSVFASRRFARFAEPIRTTQNTAPSRTNSARLTSPTMSSCSGRTAAPQPLSSSGYCSSSLPEIAVISACAAATLTPGLSRAIPRKLWLLRTARSCGVQPSGTQRSAFSGWAERRGTTPATMYGSLFSEMDVPTTDGSAPKLRRHRFSLIMTERVAAGELSPGPSVRPTSGWMPRIEKKSSVTAVARSASGSLWPVNV